MSLSLLMNTKQLLLDLKSDKVNVRARCLNELNNIFDVRRDDLVVALNANHSSRSDDDDVILKWSDLFRELHDAIKDQCMRIDAAKRTPSQKTIIAKNDIYKGLLRRCINLANVQIPNVPYTKICHAVFEALETPSIRTYFVDVYMQIVFRHILEAKHTLSDLKISDWSRLLYYLFQLYNDDECEIPKIELLKCIPLTVRYGTKYRYLVGDLIRYLPNVIQIANESQAANYAQKQIQFIVYEFIRSLAVNHRLSVIGFTEQVLDKLLKPYQFSMDEELKLNLFKIMHISIVVHSPEPLTDVQGCLLIGESGQNDDLFRKTIAEDTQVWYKLLKLMLKITEREMLESRKSSMGEVQVPVIRQTFVRMAAKLCSVAFWNEEIWASGSGNEEQQQKKRRRSMRLERLFEHIEYEPTKFSWQWFAVLSQLLDEFPNVLKAEDYQPLLKLLADYRQTIKYSHQMKHFVRVVHAMQSKEQELKANSTQIIQSFCIEHWYKIMQLSFKHAAADKMQPENLDLMRVLIENKVIVSLDFIKEVISEITNISNIRKTNSSISLLISIFRNVNTDMIGGINNLKIAIIKWLNSKAKLRELLKTLENSDVLDKQLVSELYVVCVLSRHDTTNNNHHKFEENENFQDGPEVLEHEIFVKDLVKNLQYRMMSRLIVTDTLSMINQHKENFIESLPEKNNVKAYLNETIFAELDKEINDNSNILNENPLENFQSISLSLATNVNILNALVGYESIDCDTFRSFLNKRIFFKMNQLNSIVQSFKESGVLDTPNDVNDVVENLLGIWHDNYQPIITENMFIAAHSKAIIDWLKAELKASKKCESMVLEPLKSVRELKWEERIQLKILTLLVHFCAYEDEDSETDVFETLQDYEFNYNRNTDLFMVMELIKIVFNKKCPPESLVDWAFGEMKEICENHHTHHGYMELAADLIPGLIKCVKPYPRLHDDLIVSLLLPYLKQVKSKKFGPNIGIKIIDSVRYFAQEFFKEEDCFATFAYLKHFLKSDYLYIRFATVTCLTSIFNKQWLHYNEDEISCRIIQNFHSNLMKELEIEELSIDPGKDNDWKSCLVATRLQLYCSVIGVCYPLRRQAWFGVIEFCSETLKLNEAKTSEIIEKLCTDVFNSKPSKFLADLFPHLIALWIDKAYHLNRFPAKLTQCKTRNDFIIDYMDAITLQILLYKSECLPDLLQMTDANSLSDILTMPVLIKCLTRLISIQADLTSTKESIASATNILKILRKEKPRIEDYFDSHSLEIIGELLNNFWDDGKCRDMFAIDVEFVSDVHTIDHKTFLKSLEFIQQKALKSTNIIDHFCDKSPRKIVNVLYSLKLLLQNATCDELKLSQMLRICVFIEMITDFLIENAHKKSQFHAVGFFVRDFIYFFGNIICSDYNVKLKLAACRYLLKFCGKILPGCGEHVQTHLNYIVSVMMQITKTEAEAKIFAAGMDLLRFLIVDQTEVLKSAIGQLDSFPKLGDFDELRTIQNNVKYNGKEFTLLDEIEYFLSVEKRKVEGLLSLKEHLSKKKNELQEIYQTIYESRGFSEDCEKSPIHRLISALLAQIVQNVDSKKSLIAAKCLAELGPSDLGSIALKFDVQHQTYKICKSFDDAVSNLCEHALDKLNGIFIHSDATVTQAAADACIHLFETRQGLSHIDNYPLLKIFETGIVAQMPLNQNEQTLDLEKLFSDNGFCSKHTFWVKSLAIEMFTLFGSEPLAQVAAKQSQFSTAMVPLLFKALLTTNNSAHLCSLNSAINVFFSKTLETFNADAMEVDNNEMDSNVPVYHNKVSIKLMLNIAECIRMHNQSCVQDSKLKIKYLHIAKAALFCEAYFTAILYGELAWNESPDDAAKSEIQSIMKTAYQLIGETDAIPAFLDPIEQNTENLELNGRWNEILISMDAKTNDFSQYTKYLCEAGLYRLAHELSKRGSNTPTYECAWRLGEWDIVEDGAALVQISDTPHEFDKYHYFALKNLQQKDQIGTKLNVEKAFQAIIKMFKQSSYECSKNVYKNLMMLHLLNQIEDFSEVQFLNSDEESIQQLITKWKHQDQISSSGFKYREPILAQRVTIFESAGVRFKRKLTNVWQTNNGIQHMYIELVDRCREEGVFNLGKRYLSKLQEKSLSKEMKARTYIADAQWNWSNGELETAQNLISNVIATKLPSITHAKALGMMGKYLAETRLEDPNTIVKCYLMKSNKFSASYLKQADNFSKNEYYLPAEERQRFHLKNMKRNYQVMAKYADREYERMAAYRKSTVFEKKQASIKRNKSILADMQKRSKSLTNDENKSFTVLLKSVSIDESDVKTTISEYEQYLRMAVEGYIQSILFEAQDEMNSSALFRLFSLWISNASDEIVLKEVEDNYTRIPTYKFIPLMPQITTHLNSDGIKHVIEDIIYRTALQHPHHVLPKVLALVNAFKDDEFIKDSKHKSAISSSPRTDAAIKFLMKMKDNCELRDIIGQMERMFEALIRLANTKMDNIREFHADEPIRNLRNLDKVHCPTVPLLVSASGDYKQKIVTIRKWKSTFSQPGGINAPKRIECVCSNGKQYSQLLKGTDDLRQDAVMQQVFNIMNDMLSKSKITKKDRLNVRTYTIMPLSQRSGILEWCDNTMPLTEYLVGSSNQKGAHERFRPQDWTPKQCRSQLAKTPLRKHSFEEIYKNFTDICNNIKPVFHHFFFEHFHNPGVWFERRMAYAHSLATTSMFGYILGIGDRHVSNILIDNSTAELVHIDFGIAFEQGKCLPTPELIPFRLTRDMVSALGPAGVEGVFRKSCEKTMEVLRQNKSTILTIVEVLLHDPLYTWALTSNQASKRQQTSIQIDEDHDVNSMAERALSRLEEKLDGKHVSRSDGITVKRHVEILIKEATNEKYLCRLFVGWQPYL